MFIASAAATGGGMNRSSSISMHKSPSLKMSQPIDIYPNGSPETGCFCFP